MGDWAPHVYGSGIIAVAVLIMRWFPRSWMAVELRRPYGIRGSGLDGQLLRRDYFRGSAICLGVALLLLVVGFAFAMLSEHYPAMSRANWAAAAYMFGAVLLAGVAFLSSLIMAWNGIRWRPSAENLSGNDERAV